MRHAGNVRRKADISQLSLPSTERNQQLKSGKRKLKSKQRISSEISGVQRICGISSEEEKEGYGGKDLQKRKVLSLQ